MEALPTSLGILVLLVFMLWFAVGTQRNIRRGNDILSWLQQALPQIGKRTTLRWLGSSAVQLNISQAHDPLREAEVVVALEPRDLSVLWALSRARGRRDLVILRGRLVRAPRFELEAGDVNAWTGRDGLRRIDPEAWEHADCGAEGVEVVHSRDADPQSMRRFWERFDTASGGIARLSVRRDNPHLEVHVRPPDLTATDASPLIEAFRDLARSAVRS